MQNEMNMKIKTHRCVPRNSQINLSAQEFEWDKRFPLSFITNRRKLADTPDILEVVQNIQKKYGKKKIMIQITDDPRFYPQPLSEKQKYRLRKLDAVIEGVPGNGNKCLYPQGRALENFDDS